MVIKRNALLERLKELDVVVAELRQYDATTLAELRANLSHRWILERGLIAAATLILDTAEHILSGRFGVYADTYEESLAELRRHQVISDALYEEIKGLGSFRNVLVHLYQEIDPQRVLESYHKALTVFPRFAQEILVWLDAQEREGG